MYTIKNMIKNEDDYEIEPDIIQNSWSLNYVLTHVSKQIIQILMLIAVFVIIYMVDRIVYFNSMIYGTTQVIPGLPGGTTAPSNKQQLPIKTSKRVGKNKK